MKRSIWTCLWLAAGMVMVFQTRLAAEQGTRKVLWEIGKADNDTREFAFGPDGYAKHAATFRADPVFVVGQSDPKRDWPYWHCGPVDGGLLGSRAHTCSILFGVKQAVREGNCRLVLDLVDTHNVAPPKLRISINGHVSEHQTPKGPGDASVFGDPSKGREHRIEIEVPSALLKAGTNEVLITNLAGSWILYDWIGFEGPQELEIAPVGRVARLLSLRSDPGLLRRGDEKLVQAIELGLLLAGESTEVTVRTDRTEPLKEQLTSGIHTMELLVPAVDRRSTLAVEVQVAGKTVASREFVLHPVRKWVVYLLAHSHVDIGYTELQTKVERDHWRFYEQSIAASKNTQGYPEGAQFKWNVEVLWAVDSYLKQASPEKRQEFIEAVRKGWIGLDALYGNEMTGLCRAEELLRLVDLAGRLQDQHGVKIESAMISDVPGHSWGIVPALAQIGVKYLSSGPNNGYRIGHTLAAWGDRPFYWVSPCGRHKVLCWVAGKGYYRAITVGDRSGRALFAYLRQLEEVGYPYEIVQNRYSLGDNQGPGLGMSDFVKDWNAKYAYPKLVLATTAEMFREFERRYRDKIPQARGDYTPTWEDGAVSSARETAVNRAASERLVQAEALWAMLDRENYPDDEFYAAWRNVVLYNEHTWGAHCSVTQPDSKFTTSQWKIKQAFALDAGKQSHSLVETALAGHVSTAEQVKAVDVFNTCSWRRTDLVMLPRELAVAGEVATDADGRPVATQRLADGALALLAADVPPLGAKRFFFEAGDASPHGSAKAEGTTLNNRRLRLKVNETTGAIASLSIEGIDAELIDSDSGMGANEYLYVPSRDPKDAVRIAAVKITAEDRGPLVASLRVESDAPGCRRLTRRLRVVDGISRVDVINLVDKEKIRTKESVHFAFPWKVPQGVMRMDMPWAVVRPETDQLPGANKNYFTVGRWIDVSTGDYGVTWATVDAPLVEVGRITIDPLVVGWLKRLQPSQTFYSCVMHNYHETNWLADQQGPTTFRYSVQPHGPYDQAAAARFGIEQSQPLLVVPVDADGPQQGSLLHVEPASVLVSSLKPSRDGKALMIRLYNAGSHPADAKLRWSALAPQKVFLSSPREEQGPDFTSTAHLPPYGILTLRAELPD